jgi:hypothetical protein
MSAELSTADAGASWAHIGTVLGVADARSPNPPSDTPAITSLHGILDLLDTQ